MITACQSSTPPSVVLTEPPVELTAFCPQLPRLGGKKGKDILPWAHKVVNEYNQCKAKHAALVRAWPKTQVKK